MKKISSIILAFLLVASGAQATVDVQGNAFIVTQNVQSEEYEVTQVPARFCVGIPQHSLAMAITKPVKIVSNYGCGDMAFEENINVATCAKITSEEVYNGNQYEGDKVKIIVDLSACGNMALNQGFLYAFKTAVFKTFNGVNIQVTSFEMK